MFEMTHFPVFSIYTLLQGLYIIYSGKYTVLIHMQIL